MATDPDRQLERLTAYIDGELPPDQADSVRETIAADEQARKMVESLYRLRRELASLPRYELPAGVVAAAWERVHGEPHVVPADRRQGWKTVAALLLTVASISMLALLVRTGIGPQRPDGGMVQHHRMEDAAEPGAMPGGSLVGQDQALPAVASYVFVVELWPSKKAVEDHAFEQVLATYGIPFDNSIQVDDQLEDALLRSRILKQRRLKQDKSGTEAASKAAAGAESGPAPDLVFVLAPAKDIDRMIMDLKADRDAFTKVKFDMAIKPEQLKVFQRLRQAAEMVLADSRTDGKPHAMRLVFDSMPMRHGMWRRSGELPLSLLGMFTMFVSQDANQPGEPQSGTAAPAGVPPVIDPAMAEKIRRLEAMEAEVLFVIHPPEAE